MSDNPANHEKLGWFVNPSRTEYDLAIYGAGAAGLSAAAYGASDGLKTVLVERSTVDGQAGSSSKIENHLGYPKGIKGAERAERAREQGIGYLEDGTKIVARASICATGVELVHRYLVGG